MTAQWETAVWRPPIFPSGKELVVEGSLNGDVTIVDGGKLRTLSDLRIGYFHDPNIGARARLSIINGFWARYSSTNAEISYGTGLYFDGAVSEFPIRHGTMRAICD